MVEGGGPGVWVSGAGVLLSSVSNLDTNYQ